MPIHEKNQEMNTISRYGGKHQIESKVVPLREERKGQGEGKGLLFFTSFREIFDSFKLYTSITSKEKDYSYIGPYIIFSNPHTT